MRFDKYDAESGGFRALLAATYNGADNALGVGLDSNGKIVAGAGVTGIVGVICFPVAYGQLIANTYVKLAGEALDVMTSGEIVEAGLAAATRYYADGTTGVISSTPSAYFIGHTVTADHLIVRVAAIAANSVVGDQAAIVHLTDSSGGSANNTVESVPAATAAVTDTTAASLTSTNASITALKNNDADLTTKVNAILTALEAAGLLIP